MEDNNAISTIFSGALPFYNISVYPRSDLNLVDPLGQ